MSCRRKRTGWRLVGGSGGPAGVRPSLPAGTALGLAADLGQRRESHHGDRHEREVALRPRRIRACAPAEGTSATTPSHLGDSYGQTEDRKGAAEAGFDRHLVKPLTPEELQRAIDG
jgi:hypothetical protein